MQSYSDLIVRLEPVIMEMERQTDIIVIGHQVRRPGQRVHACVNPVLTA